MGKTAHLNSIRDMEFKICTQNISKKAATFQRREIRMYFNYEVINMRSTFFFFHHPLMWYVTLFRCSYISIWLSLFLSRVFFLILFLSFFFLIVQSLFMSSLMQALEKIIYLSVLINYHRRNREWFLFKTDGLVL